MNDGCPVVLVTVFWDAAFKTKGFSAGAVAKFTAVHMVGSGTYSCAPPRRDVGVEAERTKLSVVVMIIFTVSRGAPSGTIQSTHG